MLTAFELAGFAAAHAVWSLSEADSLSPFVAFQMDNGERALERFVHDDAGQAVELARHRLKNPPPEAEDGVLVHLGQLSIDDHDETLAAIILEPRCHAFLDARAAVAVTYLPRATGAFKVHTPQLLMWDECDDFDMDAAFQFFLSGIASHEQGAEVWHRALDDSQ